MKNKRGEEIPLEYVIFIVLNLVFFAALIVFVIRSASGAAVIEEVYAKQIALTLDSIKPNMNVTLDLKDLYDTAEKNDFPLDNIFSYNAYHHLITLKAASGGGYSFHYYSQFNKLIFHLDKDKKTIRIET